MNDLALLGLDYIRRHGSCPYCLSYIKNVIYKTYVPTQYHNYLVHFHVYSCVECGYMVSHTAEIHHKFKAGK